MVAIGSWAPPVREAVGEHQVVHMTASASGAAAGIAWAAGVLPERYASPSRIAGILETLGKPAAAKYLRNKLPTDTKARSGDVGEILGVQYAEQELGYRAIARFRWKDHPNMAMRGDDIIGIRTPRSGTIEFLKGEIKSRLRLSSTTVAEADEALRGDEGRPSPHALEFVADRLHDQGEDDLARLIDAALLAHGIGEDQVVQLLFTFTENDPRTALRNNTKAYNKGVRRYAVGLQVPNHQQFIIDVYAKVIADA
ncbi:Hachiman antiphage defense system protein HamA [Nocardia niigatensis]